MTSHLKMGVEPTREMLCISNVPQTIDIIGIMHKILSKQIVNQP